ncbi:MAG TPA: hypothetical protein VEH06_10190, partial [Candidatus Bathyarchaeia archaeon]|nr:hypothetical protein [Candidatus Bathyarchaeia archaeon]
MQRGTTFGSPFSSINPIRMSKLLLLFAIKFFVSSSVIASPIAGNALIIFIIPSYMINRYISKSISYAIIWLQYILSMISLSSILLSMAKTIIDESRVNGR